MAELKPCPFCGGIPTVEDCECGDKRFFVSCKCGIVQDKLYRQRCDAIKRWNTRCRQPSAQPVIRCKDCKWKQGSECVRFADVRPFDDDFCSRAERRTDEYRICNGMPFAETN